MKRPFSLHESTKDKILLWLINDKQLTPDQAQDRLDFFPMLTYTEWERSKIKKIIK